MMFDITEKDILQAKETLLISKDPLVFKVFPKKEKRKYILICMLVHLFNEHHSYSEFEINDLLKPVYEDFATLRRYLIDYHLLRRTPDGRVYQLNVQKKDYESYL